MVKSGPPQVGATPSKRHHRGAARQIRFAVAHWSLGAIFVTQNNRGVCAIVLGDGADERVRVLQNGFPGTQLLGANKAEERLIEQVIGLIEAPGAGLELPLPVRGTAFQQRVWQTIRDIPPGSTASVRSIAVRIGAPRAARVVAQACAANALAVAIPCHRVVRNDGGISGHGWDVERKRASLKRETKTL